VLASLAPLQNLIKVKGKLMKKITLSFISAMMLLFSCQTNAHKIPKKITFITQNGESKYVVNRGEKNFWAAFYYIQFLDNVTSSELSKYEEEEYEK